MVTTVLTKMIMVCVHQRSLPHCIDDDAEGDNDGGDHGDDAEDEDQ